MTAMVSAALLLCLSAVVLADDPGSWNLGADVMFGQSAVFSDQDKELGTQMRRGILAAFAEWNRQHPTPSLGLISYDDGYDPERCENNTRRLITEDGVFALIGQVGTPTSQRAITLVDEHHIPFIGPFTGAGFLRQPFNNSFSFHRYVINYRASYADETAAMVHAAVERLYLAKISIFYQNDGFGTAGLEGVRSALHSRRMRIHSWGTYERGSQDIEPGLANMTARPLEEPDFVVLVGTYKPMARFVEAARKHWKNTWFCALSFVGSAQFSKELSAEAREGICVTQVVELPNKTDHALVSGYQDALYQVFPFAEPDFTSLEGYLVGRLAAKVTHAVWHEQEEILVSSRSGGMNSSVFLKMKEMFLDYVYETGIIHIGSGRVDYRLGPYGAPLLTECLHKGNGCGCNQGMRRIIGSQIRADGSFEEAQVLDMDFESCGIELKKWNVLFGQTVATSSRQGQELRQGSLAALEAANRDNSLGNTLLGLLTYDDGFDPLRAAENTRRLKDKDVVFAMLSSGQQETVHAVAKELAKSKVPLVGAPSGSGTLRHSPFREHFINIRASVDDEAYAMTSYVADREWQDVVLVCQLPFGEEACTAMERALRTRGLAVLKRINASMLADSKPDLEAAVQNFSSAVESVASSPEVLLLATSAPFAAEVIRTAHRRWPTCSFLSFAQVGAEELAAELSRPPAGQWQVFVSQVVPNPHAKMQGSGSLILKYRADLEALNSSAKPSFASLEGYMAAKLAVELLARMTSGVGRSTFVDRLYRDQTVFLTPDEKLGSFTKATLEPDSGCNQDTGKTFVTKLRGDGSWEYVDDYHVDNKLCGRPHDECASGMFRKSASKLCQVCQRGNATDGVECWPCDIGEYGTRNSNCQKCPPGTYSSTQGQSTCRECSNGILNGSTSCEVCPAGRSFDEASKQCDRTEWFWINMLGVFFPLLLLDLWLLPFALGVLPVFIQDITFDKQTRKLEVTTNGRHFICNVLRRLPLTVQLRGTGNPALERLFLAKVLSRERLQILSLDSTEELDESMESSRGTVQATMPWRIMRSGCLGIPFLVLQPFLSLIVGAVAITYWDGFHFDPAVWVGTTAGAVLCALALHRMQYFSRRSTPLERRLSRYRRKIADHNPYPQACDRGPNRAISQGQLQDFFMFFSDFIKDRNMYYTDANLVRPLTASSKLSFAELVGPSSVMWFVSHYWGTPFKHFVESIRLHANTVSSGNNPSTSRLRLQVEPYLDIRYWICLFSNNQWSVSTELGCSWNDSSFYLTLSSGLCQGTAMILDADALPLTRSWCLFEVLQTFVLTKTDSNFKGLFLCTASGVLNPGDAVLNHVHESCTGVDVCLALADRLTRLRLEDACASRQEDKEMIEDLVTQMPGGFDAVNVFVRKIFQEALSIMKDRFDNNFETLKAVLKDTAAEVQQQETEAVRKNPNSFFHQASQYLEVNELQTKRSSESGSVYGIRFRRGDSCQSAPAILQDCWSQSLGSAIFSPKKGTGASPGTTYKGHSLGLSCEHNDVESPLRATRL